MFDELDENLQKEFRGYLESRGVTPELGEFRERGRGACVCGCDVHALQSYTGLQGVLQDGRRKRAWGCQSVGLHGHIPGPASSQAPGLLICNMLTLRPPHHTAGEYLRHLVYDKEQREYMAWLKRAQDFVSSK